jgi:2-polyprenyl-3-methyl-5-hydroxy-6-metoxy-1,4-benzoquinol methylase
MDKTKNSVSIFNKLAHEYQNKFMDVSLYHDTFNLFCDNIHQQNAEVLELACGPGNITKYLLSRRRDLRILGIDLAPNMIGLAKTNNPGAEFKVMDCREIAGLQTNYDAVMCGFCLPYLSKEESLKLINDASQLLNPGGIIYISTMEDDYARSGFKKGSAGDEIFMHYHESAYLIAALEKNGFKLLDLQRKVYPADDETQITDLIIIAGK